MIKKLFGYTIEELKAYFMEVVEETKEFIIKNGLVEDFVEKYDEFISRIYIDENGELFTVIDLPYSGYTGMSEREYHSKRSVDIIVRQPALEYVGHHEDEFDSFNAMQVWYKEYVSESLEFMSFEDFLEELA